MPFNKETASISGSKSSRKGVPNRLTKELRATLKNLVYQELNNLPELLNSLESKERLELTIKLLPFVIPKVRNMHMTENEPLDWGI